MRRFFRINCAGPKYPFSGRRADGSVDQTVHKNLQDEPKIQEMQQVPGIQSTNDIENVVSRIKSFSQS